MKRTPEFEARANNAIALRREGRFAEAVREFKRLLEESPDDPAILGLLAGTLYHDLDDPQQAQPLFARQVELRPKSIRGSMGLILSSFKFDVDAGFKELQRFLMSDKESWEHERLLADIVLENSVVLPPFFELAAELWLQQRRSPTPPTEEDDPPSNNDGDTNAPVIRFKDLSEDVKTALRLAEDHYDEGRIDAALAIIEKHLDSCWDAPGVLAIAAEFYLDGSDDAEMAIKLLKRSVEINPGAWRPSLKLVRAYLKHGEPDLAFEELDRFVFDYEAEEHEQLLQELIEKHGEHRDRAMVLAAELWANTVEDWPDEADDQG
jgi:tetratricopeptide (TPR) repeat protein